jgi:predicted transcriptional regulator
MSGMKRKYFSIAFAASLSVRIVVTPKYIHRQAVRALQAQ